MTSAACDMPGSVHGGETISAVRASHLPWRRGVVWRASCRCGWTADYLVPGDAGRALAQHPAWDMLTKALR